MFIIPIHTHRCTTKDLHITQRLFDAKFISLPQDIILPEIIYKTVEVIAGK